MEQGAAVPQRGQRRAQARLRTRQRITHAAVEIFEQQGYEQTTVEQIAHAAGVGLRTFYRYCATKDDVLSLDLRDGPSAWVGAVKRHNALSLVEAVVAGLVEAAGDDLNRRILRVTLTSPPLTAAWLAAGQAARDGLLEVVAAHRRDLDDYRVRVLATGIAAALMVASERWAVGDEDDLEALARAALSTLGIDPVR